MEAAGPAEPIISTPRLILRPFRPEDAPALFTILAEPNIMQHFPNPTTPDMARVQRLIARQIEGWETYGRTFWAMEWGATGELIGWCGLQYLPDTDETEVGYLLAKNLWVSGGYNFAGYHDRDFEDVDYTQQGPYLRLRFKFDENNLRWLE